MDKNDDGKIQFVEFLKTCCDTKDVSFPPVG